MSLTTLELNQEYCLLKGSPSPLGATVEPDGVNFSLFSQNATSVKLYLFENAEDESPTVIDVPLSANHIWCIKVAGIKENQLYAYSVDGPYELEKGHRFNASKILLDPYAKSIGRVLKHDPALFAYQLETGDDSQLASDSNLNVAPLGRIADSHFDWQGIEPPKYPLNELIVYEAHVKGFTQLNPDIPESLRGTYLGVAHDASISYLKKLGVTALELLPVQHFIDDSFLIDKNLKNYWGYNTLNFFSPEPRYVCSDSNLSDIDQFKTMVMALHKAGIEVIMDVVYNHTCEGNQLGPTLSFRGIDNASYYRLADDQRYYYDTSGCGNAFNYDHPFVLQLLMDSLRYWVTEMQVDGFRFDLASSLGREKGYFDSNAAFFKAISQDPVLNKVKLIAEPWDVEGDGYQVGNFPIIWSEWNGRFRDAIRSYWKGDEGQMGTFATGFSGSSLLYEKSGRTPFSSVNYVTCHDGFTLNDLVSYNDKHNEDNQDNNHDGDNHNLSWNCGEEGPSQNADITALRHKQIKNMLATVLLSFGVPMLNSGDEIARTQNGNNNGYCQDNKLTWLNWSNKNGNYIDLVAHLISLRKHNAIYKKHSFFKGNHSDGNTGNGVTDITWFNPDGTSLRDEHWQNPVHKSFACFINANVVASDMPDIDAAELKEKSKKSLVFMFNSHFEAIDYTLPEAIESYTWNCVLDTNSDSLDVTELQDSHLTLAPRSIVVLQEA